MGRGWISEQLSSLQKNRRRMENHADADHIEIFEPAGLDHNQLGADRHAGMQIDNVLLQQADAAT